MADRKRAATEGGVALAISMRGEIDRLTVRVDVLEADKLARDNTIADMASKLLEKNAELAAEKIKHGATLAAHELLKAANTAEIAALRAQFAHESGLVEATLEVAKETGRGADATEKVAEKK